MKTENQYKDIENIDLSDIKIPLKYKLYLPIHFCITFIWIIKQKIKYRKMFGKNKQN